MLLKVGVVIVIGSILGLDVRAAFQGMLSHPLVVGTLTGAVMGDAWVGFQVGAIVGLLWVHVLPVGGAIPPNGTVIAIVTACLGVATGGAAEAICLSLLLAVPFGLLARWMDGALRQLNVTVSRSVIGAEASDRDKALVLSQGFGLVCVWLEVVICLSLALSIGLMILPPFLEIVPEGVRRGLQVSYALLPMVGIAAVVRTLNRRNAWVLVGGVCLLLVALASQLGGSW